MKRAETLVKEINNHYGVEVAFIEKASDGTDLVKVTCEKETEEYTFDYYGIVNNYPDISEYLKKIADREEGYWEFDNPAVITLAR